MRNFIEKLNFVKKIQKKIDEKNSCKNYSSTLPVSNNNFNLVNNIVTEHIFVEEKKVGNSFNVCSFSKEGCRGEYCDDEIEYVNFNFFDSISKKIKLKRESSMVKFNSWKKTCSVKINDGKRVLSSIRNFGFNNMFKCVKDNMTIFSLKKFREPKIKLCKFSQYDGEVVYNWNENYDGKTYVIDKVNQSKVAVILNKSVKTLKKYHLVKDNKFVRYINGKACVKIRLANSSDAYFIGKNDKQDDVVWYYPEKNNNKQDKIKMPNLILVLNLHKPQNQAYLIKNLTAASLTFAISLCCAGPVSGLVSKVKDLVGSESSSRQVISVRNNHFDNDEYIMKKTYGDLHDINKKAVTFENSNYHASSTKFTKVNLTTSTSNMVNNNDTINIGDSVTTNTNTIYRGVSDASSKINGIKAANACDKVREVELIGLNYDGKIVYSSDQKVIDEYRMKGATDTAYLTYIDDCCEGYYAADNVKKLVKTL